jgi:hypothetical protein
MLQAFELFIIVAATAVVAAVVGFGVLIAISKLSGKKSKS